MSDVMFPELPPGTIIDKICPDCRVPMDWRDDEWGYFCHSCITNWCVRRARFIKGEDGYWKTYKEWGK